MIWFDWNVWLLKYMLWTIIMDNEMFLFIVDGKNERVFMLKTNVMKNIIHW